MKDPTGVINVRVALSKRLPALLTYTLPLLLCVYMYMYIHYMFTVFILTVDALRGISEEYATGFGGFGDKRATPFSLPSSNILTYQVEIPPGSR